MVELKKLVTGACILDIMISELGHRQEPGLIVLFSIDKCPKISLNHIILPLSLAVYLQMKCNEQLPFNPKKMVWQGLELRDKR